MAQFPVRLIGMYLSTSFSIVTPMSLRKLKRLSKWRTHKHKLLLRQQQLLHPLKLQLFMIHLKFHPSLPRQQ